MKYKFQYHGSIGGKKVFTIVTDDGRGLRQVGVDVCFYHYVQDMETGVLKRVSYMDGTLAECNTVIHNGNKTTPSKSQLVTFEEAKSELERLGQENAEFEGVGKAKEITFEIIQYFLFTLKYDNQITKQAYFDGVTLHDAISKALANNPRAIGIELYKENPYVKIYSTYGLQKMIEDTKEKIQIKIKEREDVGLSWTPLHIENHKMTIDQEVASLRNDIDLFQEALLIKKNEKRVM